MSFKCFLCHSCEEDPVIYGEIKVLEDITVHYYCLLLGPNLVNNGADDDGIMGFLPADIRTEEKRIKNQQCHFCKKKHANLSCNIKRCQRSFHTNCGINKHCLLQFSGSFPAFCNSHALKEVKDDSQHEKDEECGICLSPLGDYDKIKSIRAPCCHKSWFHQYCLQKYANYGGYFFKCPLCNDVDVISENIRKRGVFIPEKDAEWELEPQAFSDLLERPTKCEALECICTRGRNHSDEEYWPISRCKSCGAVAMHDRCLTGVQSKFLCDLCIKIVPEDAECLESSDSEESEEESWDTSSEEEIVVAPWKSKKIKKICIMDSSDEEEKTPVKKILFYRHELIDLGNHKMLESVVKVKDCCSKEKTKNVDENFEKLDQTIENDITMSSCASYVERLRSLSRDSSADEVQCNLISSSKHYEKSSIIFKELKEKSWEQQEAEERKTACTFLESSKMDVSGGSGSSRDENSNKYNIDNKTTSKRKHEDISPEKPDAKKKKFNSPALPTKNSNVQRKTLGVSKRRPISQSGK